MTQDETESMIRLHEKHMARIDADMQGTSGHVRDAYEATYDKHLMDVAKLRQELAAMKTKVSSRKGSGGSNGKA